MSEVERTEIENKYERNGEAATDGPECDAEGDEATHSSGGCGGNRSRRVILPFHTDPLDVLEPHYQIRSNAQPAAEGGKTYVEEEPGMARSE